MMKPTATLLLLGLLSLATTQLYAADDEATKVAREGSEAAKTGDWDKAVASFRKASEMNGKWKKDLDAALEQRGSANMKAQKFPEAMADFTEALNINPHDAATLERRAYVEMKLNNMDKALEDYTSAIKINPKEVRYYLLRSYIYESKSDVKNSMADTDQVLKLDPKNAEAQARKDRLNKIQTMQANQPGATPIPPPPQA